MAFKCIWSVGSGFYGSYKLTELSFQPRPESFLSYTHRTLLLNARTIHYFKFTLGLSIDHSLSYLRTSRRGSWELAIKNGINQAGKLPMISTICSDTLLISHLLCFPLIPSLSLSLFFFFVNAGFNYGGLLYLSFLNVINEKKKAIELRKLHQEPTGI